MGTQDTSEARKLTRLIGSRLRQERERHAWTQSEVAERIGTTQINVSRWENGVTTPGLYYRQRLAELFEKDIQELGFVPTNSREPAEKAPSFLDHSSTSPSPVWNITYRRNPFFTGREEIIKQLYTEFSRRQTTSIPLALSGLGGIGKTQIAIEYAYQYRDSYQAIFWLNASTRDTLSTDLITIGSLLGLIQPQEQEEAIVQVVERWLTTHTGWLVILDNVDSLETIIDFLPIYGTGNILLTTRIQVVGTIAQSIPVENMTLDEGILFLLHRTKLLAPGVPLEQVPHISQAYAADIVRELGGLPLALDQASAYMEETHCGISHYLQRYTSHRNELLLRRGSFPMDHPDPVATTWQLSFQKIEEKWPASAELLSLCAFLDSDSIPEEFLIAGASKLGPILSKMLGDPLKLDSVLEPLHMYSLIRRSPETHTLAVHRLVQAVLRQQFPPSAQKQWAKRIIRALHLAFPDVDATTWTQCQHLLSQVQVCVRFFDEYSLFLPEAGHLFERAGDYATKRAMFARAEIFLQRTVTIFERTFSPEHLSTAGGLHKLGEVYRKWGRYEEAEALLLRTLAIYEESLPPPHDDIADTLNSLGELYHNVGRYEEAEPLFQRALSLNQSTNEPEHPTLFMTLHNLARLYHSQQRYPEAMDIYHQVLIAQQQQPRPDQEQIAVLLSNLAIVYRAQENYEQAEALLLQALQIEEKMLGPHHPRTATALHNLGVVYQKQGLYESAEDIFLRALAIKEVALGSEHPSTVKTLTNLAYLYQAQKRYHEAQALLQRALKFDTGKDHPYTAVILRNLARFYHEQREYKEAEGFYLRSLSISEKLSPITHKDMKITLKYLAELYRTTGREEEAVNVEQRLISLD